MKFAYVYISVIFRQQQRIIQAGTDNYSLFYVIPIVCGLIFSIIFYKDRSNVLNVLTLFLSIFIPIFINLLATLISFVMNKIVTRHNKERVPLIKETFYNICYLIPISLLLLILSLFMNLSWGRNIEIEICNKYLTISFSIHRLMLTLIGTMFYGGIIHIMLNLLMITKRIFKLFDKEIDLLTDEKPNTTSSTTAHTDANALDGEE